MTSCIYIIAINIAGLNHNGPETKILSALLGTSAMLVLRTVKAVQGDDECLVRKWGHNGLKGKKKNN